MPGFRIGNTVFLTRVVKRLDHIWAQLTAVSRCCRQPSGVLLVFILFLLGDGGCCSGGGGRKTKPSADSCDA